MYAINVADLTKDSIIGQILVAPHIKTKTVVKTEPKYVDGSAVVLDCDDETAENIVAVIRMRYTKNELRCYYSKSGNGGWERI